MAEPLVLDAKQCALILTDMTNAITKGQGSPYTTPPHREALVQNCVRLVAHCRSVGTPVIYTTIYRVVSDCCTAGALEGHEMTIKHVLPLLVRVRTTDEVIAALRG
jgi:nicotinamidase-related amidase